MATANISIHRINNLERPVRLCPPAQLAICLMGSALLNAEVSDGLSLREGLRLIRECARRSKSGSDSTALIGVGRQIVSGCDCCVRFLAFLWEPLPSLLAAESARKGIV